MESFAELIDKCQRNTAHHRNAVGKLRALKDENPRQFVKQWLDLLNRILVQSKKHASIERLVKLVAALAVSCDDAFRDFTITYVVRKTDALNWAPRFRACQILSQTLKALPDDAELGDETWDEIKEKMVARLDDKAPAVRSEAVSAVERLQDPTNPDDQIINLFCDMMRNDPSGDVRKTVICHVAVSKQSLRELVQRTRDIHPPARGAAFRMLGNYVNVRNLKISQRTQLISDGLRDRDEKVQRECAKMCLTWLDNCDKDVLALLRMVDVEVAEEGAELLLRALFRDAQGAAPVRIEPTEALSSEAALYMRVLAQYWKDHVGDAASQEAFEQQVPELTSICDMMRINAGNDFALKQLLLLAQLRDFSDDAGRAALSALLRSLLPSPQVSQYLVEAIMTVLRACHSDEAEYIQVVLEMVADVREPLDMLQSEAAKVGFAKAVQRRDEMKVKFAKLRKIARVSKHEGKEEQLAKALRKAESVKAEIEAAEEAIATRSKLEEHIWYRVLCVTELLLESTRQGLKHPGILGLVDSILKPSLEQPSTVVQDKALRCLALYCLLDRTTKTVHDHIHVFLAHLDREGTDSALRTTSIKSLFDIGMLYGFAVLEEQQLVQRLSRYATDEAESSEMRGMVAEGFAKLFLMDQCHDAEMLGALLLLFFSPSTDGEVRLRQCLSVFFPAYAFSSHAHQALCARALVPAMRRILMADASSMVRKIDWSLFCKFGAHLTDSTLAQHTSAISSHEPSFHEQIALQMAFEMRGDERGFNQHWARALASFACRDPHVEGDAEATAARTRYVAKLLTAATAAAEDTHDKRARAWASKRVDTIKATLLASAGAKALVTKELLKEAADEAEEEVEVYLEQRKLELAQWRQAASGTAAAIYAQEDESHAKSPAKKKTRGVRSSKASKGATSTAAKTNWGLSVAGEDAKKRARRAQMEPVDAPDADEVAADAVDDNESPPKKGKMASRKRKEEEQPQQEVEEEEVEAMDEGGDDQDENASPPRELHTGKRAKTPPGAEMEADGVDM